jgi:hypothetical protein
MKTKLRSFGFEIEGEFSEEFTHKLTRIGTMKSDGSVHECDRGNEKEYEWHLRHDEPELNASEFNSKVFSYSVMGIAAMKRLMNAFQEASENGEYHWNHTAGLHVHVGFNPKFPPEIFSAQFKNYFLHELELAFPEEFRARKDNRYCKSAIDLKEIAKGGDRYRAINFWSAFSSHGTVEFRIFPTAEPKKMQEYIEFAIKKTAEFLKDCAINEGHSAVFSDTQEDRMSIEEKTDRNYIEVAVDAMTNIRDENKKRNVRVVPKVATQTAEYSLQVK